jgi:hypothetical protein
VREESDRTRRGTQLDEGSIDMKSGVKKQVAAGISAALLVAVEAVS